MADKKKFDFLDEYVLDLLRKNGYDNLADEVKREFLPQLVDHAETRIGASLLPKLTEESAKKMVELSKKDSVSSEEWEKFWQENVDDFEQIVKKTLEDFALEVKELLNKIKSS